MSDGDERAEGEGGDSAREDDHADAAREDDGAGGPASPRVEDAAGVAAAEAPEPEPEPEPNGDAAEPESLADDAPVSVVSDARSGLAPLVLSAAVAVGLFFVLPPLTRSGIWDPHELNVADLARRIAVNLHGASGLALEGADNSLPHLNDLGRPQLPFTSIALGFKLFGLQEWAGRAPLALWGVLGVLATYGFVARLVDRRAGVFSAVALATTPLYFVQARTMLGDIVMMSALAMSFGGLAVATFARDERGSRLPWLALAAVGLLSGYYTRGGVLGVAVPTLAVGAAWAVSRAAGRAADALADIVGGASLVFGLACAYLAHRVLAEPTVADLSPWVGAMIHPPAKYPTFDTMVGHIGPAMAPWSAFAPFALGRLFIAPPAAEDAAFRRESHARLALLLGAGFCFGAHAWLAARTDVIAFSGVAVLAAACGIALRDYERGAHPSVAVGVGTAVLLGLFHHDFHKLPEKAFNAFAIATTTFPESFKDRSLQLWTVALVGFAGLAVLTLVERDEKGRARQPFETRRYLQMLVALRDAWDGLLALAYFALVAGASLAGLVVWMGMRYKWTFLPVLSSQMKDVVLNAWWVTAFLPLLGVLGALFWADVWLWAFGGARPFGKDSFTRGFEPFEELARRLKATDVKRSLTDLVTGKMQVTKDDLDEGLGATDALVLVPLLYLQVPALVFAGLHVKGVRTFVAVALAIPSGIALMLLLGAVGDMLKGSRAAFLALGGLVVGGVLCVGYYPALANQLSPKEVFETYRRVRTGDEPLALFGVGGRTAAYYAGGQPLSFKDTASAYDWLQSPERGRRFLVVRSEELAQLNQAHRERLHQNLPVIDARSSQIILVANKLAAGEENQNPLEKIVLPEAPKPQRPIAAFLEEKLEVIGYDITDAQGRLVDRVSPGRTYHIRTYFKVLEPVTTEWMMFIHIDGYRRRHNGDHKMTGGKYPFSMWRRGDIVADDYEFKLEPNFTPGTYTVYFGLYVGDTRMKVMRGPADTEHRVNGGALRVQ